MRVWLRPTVAQAILERARQAWPHEICGFLWGQRQPGLMVITDHIPMPNASPDPRRFLIDPAAHIALLRRLREDGQEDSLLGPYHSHPSGDPRPSVYDRPAAAGELWLIAALGQPHHRGRIRTWWSHSDHFVPAFLRLTEQPEYDRKSLAPAADLRHR